MITGIVDVLSILFMLCLLPTVWLVYRKKIEFFKGVFLGTFLLLMSFVCSMYCINIEYGYTPVDIFTSNADRFLYIYSSMPEITSGELQQIKAVMAELKTFYTTLLPALLILGNLFMSYVIFMISKGIFALLRKDVSGFEKFCNIKMPGTAILLAGICYIISGIAKNSQMGYVFLNFTVIIFNVCTICGFSVVDYALRKKIRFSVLRLLIYIALLILFGSFVTSVIPFVGIADGILNFRRLGKNPTDS